MKAENNVSINKESVSKLIGDEVVKPSPSHYDVIEMEISPDRFVGDYAKAFLDQVWSVDEPLANRVNINEQELIDYIYFLIAQRVNFVNGVKSNGFKLQKLWIPAFVDLLLTEIGEVQIREFGITIKPVLGDIDVISFDEALNTSVKLSRFSDKISMYTNQFPRTPEGDVEVMSTAFVDEYLKSFSNTISPASRFVAAYLGNQLKAKEVLRGLFRVSYEPVDYMSQVIGSISMKLV